MIIFIFQRSPPARFPRKLQEAVAQNPTSRNSVQIGTFMKPSMLFLENMQISESSGNSVLYTAPKVYLHPILRSIILCNSLQVAIACHS